MKPKSGIFLLIGIAYFCLTAFLDGKRLERYRFTRDWYYFLGDNRDHSVDSRHYGLIPKDKLLGVVKVRPFAEGRGNGL